MMILFLLCLSVARSSDSDLESGTLIVVSGNGSKVVFSFPALICSLPGASSVERKPNEVLVRISLSTKGADAASASAAHKKALLPIRAHVLGFIAKHDAARDKIKHEALSVTPQQRYSHGQSHVVGYVAATQMALQLDETDDVQQLVDDLTQTGASIDGIDFRLKEKETSEVQCLSPILRVSDSHFFFSLRHRPWRRLAAWLSRMHTAMQKRLLARLTCTWFASCPSRIRAAAVGTGRILQLQKA